MARLEAQAKLGFYPVQPATIEFICGGLRCADPANTYLLDPCCGKGEALHEYAKILGVPHAHLVAIELDTGRAEAARRIMPDAQILNASFFDTRISPVQSFSLVWMNPPYDNELRQEGRSAKALEHSFMLEGVRLVTKDGIHQVPSIPYAGIGRTCQGMHPTTG